jgi:lipopolysaccharide export system protein LptA
MIITFGVTSAASAAEVLTEHDSRQPIEITSQQLEGLQQQRQTIFRGDVVAVQGDITLKTDLLTVYLQEHENQIDKMVATGSVRVEQLDRVATADEATYRRSDEVLILKGHAQVVQGANKVDGDEIVIYLQEDRTTVKSSENGRVKAVLIPEAIE